MRIYLDNNATTQLHPNVLSVLEGTLRDVYGNASSIHKEGQTARRVIEEARESVARLIAASARELVFTSGGTESNNAAIFGTVSGSGSHHIVTTTIEHPSVAEAMQELERRGHDVTFVSPGKNGVVDAAQVIAALRPQTRLVAMMLANNETGVVQPVAAVGQVCRDRGIHLHCDAVQAVGKIDVRVDDLGCSTLAVSAHKIHAPKGIGALYVRQGVILDRHLFGGAQERRRRAGTENVPMAAAFGVAAELAGEGGFKEEVARLRDRLELALRNGAPASAGRKAPAEAGAPLLNARINGIDAPRVPNTSNVTFYEADAEGIVIALDLAGVAVSTGSACSSGRVEPSKTLLAMGLAPDEARSTIRFSLSRFNTDTEIDRVVELLREVVPRCTREEKAVHPA